MTQAEQFLKERGLDPVLMRDDWTFSRPLSVVNSVSELRVRDEFVTKFGFAVLDTLTVDALRPFSPLLEVGAGSGYWAYELRKAGLDIVATDPHTGRYYHGTGDTECGVNWDKHFVEIDELEAIPAIDKYPNRNLLMVWPDMSKWPARALAHFTKVAGQHDHVLYVGEFDGGCTGDAQFHALLEEFYVRLRDVPIPQFWGLHDTLQIFQRKRTNGRKFRDD